LTRPLVGAVIGVGHMGGLHAAKLDAREDVRVRRVDPSKGFEDSLEGIDFAIVAVPTRSHAEVASPLLDRGVPVLVEKPLAATAEEAEALALHPHCYCGHIERFNPAVRAMSARMEAPAQFVQTERIAPPISRGTDVDVLRDLMVHDLDLVGWLFDGAIVDVRANGVAVRTGAFDIAHARVETENGGVATLTASRVARRSVRTLRVFTERAYWNLDLREGSVERVLWADGQLEGERVAVPQRDALDAEHDALIAAVQGHTPFPVTGQHALRALRMAEAIQADIERRR